VWSLQLAASSRPSGSGQRRPAAVARFTWSLIVVKGMSSEALTWRRLEALAEFESQYIADLAHADIGPGHRHLLERLAGLFE
jgi:hypothetical protein